MNNKFKRLNRCLFIVWLLLLGQTSFAASGGGWEQLLVQEGYIAIPMQRASKQDILLVQVSVGKQDPQVFIIDTGSRVSSIDARLAARQQFNLTGRQKITGGAGGKSHSSAQVIIPSLQLGDFVSTPELAIINDYSFIKIHQQAIAGLLGLTFLKKYHAVIDISNQRLYLKPNGKPQSPRLTRLMAAQATKNGYQLVRLYHTPSGHPTIPVSINHAAPVDFIVDTGVFQSLLSIEYASQLGLKPSGDSIKAHGSSNAAMHIYRITVPSIRVGADSWPKHEIAVSTGLQSVLVGTPVLGIIGMDWLRATHAIYNVSDGVLYVVKP